MLRGPGRRSSVRPQLGRGGRTDRLCPATAASPRQRRRGRNPRWSPHLSPKLAHANADGRQQCVPAAGHISFHGCPSSGHVFLQQFPHPLPALRPSSAALSSGFGQGSLTLALALLPLHAAANLKCTCTITSGGTSYTKSGVPLKPPPGPPRPMLLSILFRPGDVDDGECRGNLYLLLQASSATITDTVQPSYWPSAPHAHRPSDNR